MEFKLNWSSNNIISYLLKNKDLIMLNYFSKLKTIKSKLFPITFFIIIKILKNLFNK